MNHALPLKKLYSDRHLDERTTNLDEFKQLSLLRILSFYCTKARGENPSLFVQRIKHRALKLENSILRNLLRFFERTQFNA